MELKSITDAFQKKERKPPKPSYRSLFGTKDPNKKKKTKEPKKKILRASSKPKRSY